MGGGGWRSETVYRKAMEAAILDSSVHCRIVTGPYLEIDAQRRVERMGNRRVRIVRFSADIRKDMAWADVVVCRAGYNTIAETMAWEVPAICVPRERPDNEQLLHAERLTEMGVVELVREAAPATELVEAIRRSVGRCVSAYLPSLEGAVSAAKILVRLAKD